MVVLLFTSLVIPHELFLSNANLFFHLVFVHDTTLFFTYRTKQGLSYSMKPLLQFIFGSLFSVAWFCLFMFGFIWAICYFAKPY